MSESLTGVYSHSLSLEKKRRLTAIVMLLLIIATGCGGNKADSSSDSIAPEEKTDYIYHADNDIAMTVRSLVDAIKVDEPLDTIDYNFEGILTDGQGHPLYTDLQGAPGEWEVDVLSPTSAVIRNLNLGDLLPDYLRAYLVQSLELSEENMVETSEFDDDDQTSVDVFDFQGGFLRFETRSAVAPNGLEGAYMSIIATKSAPEK